MNTTKRWAAAALACAIALTATAARAQEELRTPAEISGFTEYTSYDEMIEFIGAVQATSTDMKLGSYGETWQGRDLPYIVMSRPTITQPWEALVSGKPIAVIHANVHGNERTLRESLLVMLGDFATPGTPEYDILDDVVVIMAPQINPDGFEASANGTRGNSWGIDMNRDYIKTEQAGVTNLVTNIHNTWHPHIIIDGHNGGARPYDLCYQATSNASPDSRIDELCDTKIFPYINQRMEENGFKSFYYSGGNAERWSGGGYDPRISRNYGAFINSIAILFESPHGRQTLEIGVKAGIVGYMAVLEYARDNADEVMSLVNSARRESIRLGMEPGDQVMVQMEYEAEDFPVTYEVRDPDNPGEYMTVTDGVLMTKPKVLESRTRPYAYVLPREAREAVAMLMRHGITVEVLRESVTIPVEAYTLEDVNYMSEYNHGAAVRVTVGEVVSLERQFRDGTFIITTAQMHGRLVAHMLEPETNDNVVRWNTMDAWLPKTRMGAPGDPPAGRGGGVQGRAGGRRGRGGDLQAAGRGGRRGGRRQGARAGAGGQRQGRGGRAGRGGRGGGGRGRGQAGPAVIPIYKIMQPTALPTRIFK